LIQSGRIDEIGDAISQYNQNGACSFDQSLFRLWKEGTISKEEALTHADSRANLALKFRLDNDTDAQPAEPPHFNRFL
jgi:twitching motility protein PilU